MTGDQIIHGDALAMLKTLPDNSVDAIVTDPPAGISFMGKEWDAFDGKEHRSRAAEKESKTQDGKWLEGRGTLPYGFSPDGGSTGRTKRERDSFISFMTSIMQEALRVLKPGGHAFVWSLPRTSHWTAMALEDAGWEIRDVVSHLFGSGFPKSLDVSKAIDKMEGKELQTVGYGLHVARRHSQLFGQGATQDVNVDTRAITAPATPEAEQWQGWGSALKPSHENWILCRKPLAEPSIAANVLEWGTGAINVDASRVDASNGRTHIVSKSEPSLNAFGDGLNGSYAAGRTTQGRFPSNTLLSHSIWCVPCGEKRVHVNDKAHDRHNGAREDRAIYGDYHANMTTGYADEEGFETVPAWDCAEGCPVKMLDEQSGVRKSGALKPHTENHVNATSYRLHRQKTYTSEASEGGASRYFAQFDLTPEEGSITPFIYTSKASRRERNAGCEGLPASQVFDKNTSKQIAHINHDTGKTTYSEYHPSARQNHHPTVKPLSLMSYLIRIITPPNGVVLDMFGGSGTTGVACVQNGFHYILIEQDQEYVDIIRARLAYAHAGSPEIKDKVGHATQRIAGWGHTVRHCTEHNEPHAEGSTYYKCGCPIQYTKDTSVTRQVTGFSKSIARCPVHDAPKPGKAERDTYGTTCYMCGCKIIQVHRDTERTKPQEDVEYECAEDCPVRILGEQSGERGNSYRVNRDQHKTVKSGMFSGVNGATPYNDTGTAARYFKTFPPNSLFAGMEEEAL